MARALAKRAPAAGVEALFLARPELDLADGAQVEETARRALERTGVDVLVSAAAYTNVDGAEDDEAAARAINAEAPGALARAAKGAGVPIVHLSTDYVFDGRLDRPYREDDPVAPLGVYGRTKEAGERAVREAGGDHVILRTAWVTSPFGRNFVRTMLRLAETRDEVSVVGDQHGCPTSALDSAVARALTGSRAAIRPSGTYHMTGAGEATWAELAEAVFAASRECGGPWARVRAIATSEYPTPTPRPANSRLDCSKLARDLDLALPLWQRSQTEIVRRLVGGEGQADPGAASAAQDGAATRLEDRAAPRPEDRAAPRLDDGAAPRRPA